MITALTRLRHFVRAKSGLAALEFALIAPMMVFLLFGSVELIDALGANRRAQNAASSLADVVARDTEVTNDEVQGLWAAFDILLYPDSGADMQACITSVLIDAQGVPRTQWSEARNGYSPCPAATGSLTAAMRTPGSSMIIASTTYSYTPPLNFLFTGPVNMRHTVYRRSRLVDPIPRINR
jgi:Flp pilus assembly protein TadG